MSSHLQTRALGSRLYDCWSSTTLCFCLLLNDRNRQCLFFFIQDSKIHTVKSVPSLTCASATRRFASATLLLSSSIDGGGAGEPLEGVDAAGDGEKAGFAGNFVVEAARLPCAEFFIASILAAISARFCAISAAPVRGFGPIKTDTSHVERKLTVPEPDEPLVDVYSEERL